MDVQRPTVTVVAQRWPKNPMHTHTVKSQLSSVAMRQSHHRLVDNTHTSARTHIHENYRGQQHQTYGGSGGSQAGGEEGLLWQSCQATETAFATSNLIPGAPLTRQCVCDEFDDSRWLFCTWLRVFAQICVECATASLRTSINLVFLGVHRYTTEVWGRLSVQLRFGYGGRYLKSPGFVRVIFCISGLLSNQIHEYSWNSHVTVLTRIILEVRNTTYLQIQFLFFFVRAAKKHLTI